MEKKERQISLFPYRQLENQNSSQKDYIKHRNYLWNLLLTPRTSIGKKRRNLKITASEKSKATRRLAAHDHKSASNSVAVHFRIYIRARVAFYGDALSEVITRV